MSVRVQLSRKGPFVNPWTLFASQARVVPLFGPIYSSLVVHGSTDSMPLLAEAVAGDIMYLSGLNKEPIKIVINTTGGEVTGGFQIIQAMEHAQAKGIEVWTIVQGMSASMGSIILTCGTKGRRFAFPRSGMHFHSVNRGVQGKDADVEETIQYQDRLRDQAYALLLSYTKLPELYARQEEIPSENPTRERREKWLKNFLERERYLTVAEALSAEVIDKVLEPGDALIDEIFKLPASS